MKKLINYLIPLFSLFSKTATNNAHTGMAIVLWLCVGLPCYILSGFTNLKAVDAFFSAYPPFVQSMGTVLAWTLDIIVQLSLIMAVLSFIVVRLIRENKTVKELLNSYPSEKTVIENLSIGVSVVFFAIAIGGTYFTWNFSQFGGYQWAENYVEKNYMPESAVDKKTPILDRKQAEDSVALALFNQQMARIEKQYKVHKKHRDNWDYYAENNMWGERGMAQAKEGKKWLNESYEPLKAKATEAYEKEKARIAKAYNPLLTQVDGEIARQEEVYQNKYQQLTSAAEIGVNTWSLASVIALFIVAMLSYPEYQRDGVEFIREWINQAAEDEKDNKQAYEEIQTNMEVVKESRSGMKYSAKATGAQQQGSTPPPHSGNGQVPPNGGVDPDEAIRQRMALEQQEQLARLQELQERMKEERQRERERIERERMEWEQERERKEQEERERREQERLEHEQWEREQKRSRSVLKNASPIEDGEREQNANKNVHKTQNSPSHKNGIYSRSENDASKSPTVHENEETEYKRFCRLAPNDVNVLERHWLPENGLSLQEILDKYGKEGEDILRYQSKSGLHKVGKAIQAEMEKALSEIDLQVAEDSGARDIFE